MIKKIELWNFENHSHSVFDNLHPRFNLICGPGNVGKTTIARALRLVGFNEFDPKSVRVGHDNCKVSVTTERGNVTVTRGKVNVWDVTPVGEPTQRYEKVGRSVLEPAVDIIGFRVVQLGTAELKINVMDQLESHFMLSEFDGNNASGSLRAQVIDEISGLTGIEDIIRDVSLDNLRWTKGVRKAEDANVELTKQLHDEDRINKEQSVIDRCQEMLQDAHKRRLVASELDTLLRGHQDHAGALAQMEITLKGLPDTTDVTHVVTHAKDLLAKQRTFVGILKELSAERGFVDQAKKRAMLLRVSSDVNVDAIELLLTRLSVMRTLITEYDEESKASERCEHGVKKSNVKLQDAVDEVDELLRNVKICPLTQLPITDKCGVPR